MGQNENKNINSKNKLAKFLQLNVAATNFKDQTKSVTATTIQCQTNLLKINRKINS